MSARLSRGGRAYALHMQIRLNSQSKRTNSEHEEALSAISYRWLLSLDSDQRGWPNTIKLADNWQIRLTSTKLDKIWQSWKSFQQTFQSTNCKLPVNLYTRVFGASQAISTALLADEFVPSNLPIDLITTWLVALLGTEMSSAGTCLEFHSSRCHRRRADRLQRGRSRRSSTHWKRSWTSASALRCSLSFPARAGWFQMIWLQPKR